MTSQAERTALIAKIAALPNQIAELVSNLSSTELTAHYLTDEWTVAQNVHHLADSHMNSYIRCKLIMTEENPTLRPYDQDAWAQLADGSAADISDSLAMLHHLHTRWVDFWRNLDEADWSRTGYHPESGPVTLATQLQSYADHGEAHVEQITQTLAAGA